MESGEVDGGGLVLARGRAAPLLDLVDGSFDRVPLFAGLAVERRQAAASAAEPFAVGDLVGGLRDHRPDPATAQVRADGAGRVRLVPKDRVGSRAWAPDGLRHPDPCHDVLECGCVSGLGQQGGEDLLPGAVGSPLAQPVVGALSRSEVFGEVHPRRPGAVLERDCIDHLSVITPLTTPPRQPVRQQRLDACRLGVSQRRTSNNNQMIRRKRPEWACAACGRGRCTYECGQQPVDGNQPLPRVRADRSPVRAAAAE